MIEITVHDKLKEISPNVYPMILPLATNFPAYTYDLISINTSEATINGVMPQNLRIQISIYTKTYQQLKQEYTKVISKMLTIKSYLLDANEMYENETKLYSMNIDFSVRA